MRIEEHGGGHTNRSEGYPAVEAARAANIPETELSELRRRINAIRRVPTITSEVFVFLL
jgi:hypothetical protein